MEMSTGIITRQNKIITITHFKQKPIVKGEVL